MAPISATLMMICAISKDVLTGREYSPAGGKVNR
jgi:hypothetical protein